MNRNFYFLISTIKFGILSRRLTVAVPSTIFNMKILRVLRALGYIRDFYKTTNGKTLAVDLVYAENGRPAFTNLRAISTPGRRRHMSHAEILQSFGRSSFVLISTTEGLRTLSELRRRRSFIGGEVLCVHGA